MRMRVLVGGVSALALVGVIGGAALLAPRASAQGKIEPMPVPANHPLVTQAQFERWQTELSNWGRWGKDDEMGALNLITPAKRRQAAALVKEGITVSLATNANTE